MSMKAEEAFKFLDKDLAYLAQITKDPWYKRVLRKIGLIKVDVDKEWDEAEKAWRLEAEAEDMARKKRTKKWEEAGIL